MENFCFFVSMHNLVAVMKTLHEFTKYFLDVFYTFYFMRNELYDFYINTYTLHLNIYNS